jgi:hypothetical protein
MVSRIALGIAITLSCFQVREARAAYTIDVTQDGGNVVATGFGSLNLNGLSYLDYAKGPANGSVDSSVAVLEIGSGSQYSSYSGLSGPFSFGSGASEVPGSSSNGGPVGVYGYAGVLFVPADYVSGTQLSASSTFAGATLSSLGLTPGDYTYTWQTSQPVISAITSAIDMDSLTVDIAAQTPISEPGGYALLAAPLALLGVLRRRTRGDGQSPV